MDREKGSLVPLKDIIADLFSDGVLPFDPDDMRVWKVWDEVVGPAISRNAQPAWIKKGKLRVTVSDPIWLQELIFLEKDIRNRVNERLGREAIHAIEFRVGPR